MSTPDDDVVAGGHSVDPAGWRGLFDELMCLVAGRFARVEPRRTAREFVLGLLSPAERKNCWWLAEQAGHRDPQAMQRLLRTAAWDADGVRDDVRGFVAARLGDAAGVLIPDLCRPCRYADVRRAAAGHAVLLVQEVGII